MNTIQLSSIRFQIKYADFVIYLHSDFYVDVSSTGTISSVVPCSHLLFLFSTNINSVSFCYPLKATYITTK